MTVRMLCTCGRVATELMWHSVSGGRVLVCQHCAEINHGLFRTAEESVMHRLDCCRCAARGDGEQG